MGLRKPPTVGLPAMVTVPLTDNDEAITLPSFQDSTRRHRHRPTHTAPAALHVAPYSHAWYITKLVLRIVSMVLAVALVGLSAAFTYLYIYFAFAAPVAFPSFLWNAAELITLAARRRTRRGIHTIAHVVVELFVWGIGLAASCWLVAADGSYSWRGYSYDEEAVAVNASCLGLMFAISAIHFVIFCRACVETHWWSKGRRPVEMIFVPGAIEPYIVIGGPLQAGVGLPPSYSAASDGRNAHEVGQIDAEDDDFKNFPSQKEVIPGFGH